MESDSLLRKNTFENIYKNNIWTCNGTRSGHGSELKQTIHIRKFLNDFISEKSINKV
jgi:hypothetical protein